MEALENQTQPVKNKQPIGSVLQYISIPLLLVINLSALISFFYIPYAEVAGVLVYLLYSMRKKTFYRDFLTAILFLPFAMFALHGYDTDLATRWLFHWWVPIALVGLSSYIRGLFRRPGELLKRGFRSLKEKHSIPYSISNLILLFLYIWLVLPHVTILFHAIAASVFGMVVSDNNKTSVRLGLINSILITLIWYGVYLKIWDGGFDYIHFLMNQTLVIMIPVLLAFVFLRSLYVKEVPGGGRND